MTAGDRLDVLWLGPSGAPPKTFMQRATAHGLHAVVCQPESLAEKAPEARLLAIELTGKYAGRSQVRSYIQIALNHGLQVALFLWERDKQRDLWPTKDLKAFNQAITSLRKEWGHDQVRAHYDNYEIALTDARNRPVSPGSNRDLVIRSTGPLSAAEEILVRRAFHDYDSLRLQPLTGGKSGASVWHVVPEGRAASTKPICLVAKIDSLDKIRQECSNAGIVRNNIASRHRMDARQERTVEGADKGAVVYEHVARVSAFREVVEKRPAALIRSVLTGALPQAIQTTERPVGVELADRTLKIVPWSRLRKQLRVWAMGPHPDELEALLRASPPQPCSSGFVHGDLHVGNLFVAGGSDEVVLIDYGSVMENAPTAMDAACLEVSLTFPPSHASSHTLIDPAWIREAYSFPLVSSTKAAGDWLVEAVRAIREHVYRAQCAAPAYALLVAGYLLRFATYETDNRASMAYQLASQMIAAVSRDQPALSS